MSTSKSTNIGLNMHFLCLDITKIFFHIAIYCIKNSSDVDHFIYCLHIFIYIVLLSKLRKCVQNKSDESDIYVIILMSQIWCKWSIDPEIISIVSTNLENIHVYTLFWMSFKLLRSYYTWNEKEFNTHSLYLLVQNKMFIRG